jgi:hypothetical protein
MVDFSKMELPLLTWLRLWRVRYTTRPVPQRGKKRGESTLDWFTVMARRSVRLAICT